MGLPGILLALAVQAPPPPAGPAGATSTAGPAPYWQQHVRYDIAGTLDEPNGTLSGTERIVYHNRSPDSLTTFALHLYLNAFRPLSRWSEADRAEGRRRFNDLRDPDYAFNRIANVRIEGRPVDAIWPFAPDSTVARFLLPRPLPPGDSIAVLLDWSARPSTLPRRQGRRGRHYDFAQWYPRVVAYDKRGWQEHPLYPAGEFYGEFGTFVVRLDLPEDQVVGATGVPLCGDPGWARANRTAERPPDLQREFYTGEYPARLRAACDALVAAPGRKRLLWYAEDVHHFAMSMNPEYRYEGGAFRGAAVHVLYRPGDEASWGGGVAVRNTESALAWLDELFGPYPWPQLTNVHRIEGGGTEFPMMVMDGSASLGLIVHEVGHNYLMGILANNEWREGWMDEGFTSFQSAWFFERAGQRGRHRALSHEILLSDLDGWSEPVSLVSERYRDFGTYGAMIYSRGELFFHQLRAIVGDDTLRRILRAYYARWKLKHVDEAAFRAVAEEVSGQDLSGFFAQWLHGSVLYDYSVGAVRAQRRHGAQAQGGEGARTQGEWVTRVEVVRKAPGQFPVDVIVRSDRDSAVTRATGLAEREWVELVTAGRPREVEVDPRVWSHDWNLLDNRKRRGLLGFGTRPRHDLYLDTYFSKRVARDRRTVGVAPTLWYNDEGGVTVGLRVRTDYLGRFEQNELSATLDGFHLRLRNPIRLYTPRTSHTLEGWWVEGRAGAALSVEQDRSRRRGLGPRLARGLSLRWMTTSDTDYLDPGLWDAGGTVEGELWVRRSERRGRWDLDARLGVSGGFEYRNRGIGLETDDRYDAQPYVRTTLELTARRPVGWSTALGLRLFGGYVASDTAVVKQRQLFMAGADPIEQFGNPFLRSRGALLAGHDVHYHQQGGGNVRGFLPSVAAGRLLALNVEAERAVLTRSGAAPRLLRQVRLAAFADGALSDGGAFGETGAAFAADFGLGVRATHRIGQTTFTTRLDLPLFVSRPSFARSATERRYGLRWVVGVGG